ncbi:MAG TPA: hypothetical protein HPP51_05510 [Planctomycetes bacterium]|nr:hypothetical protein [Planctomycetota bacterium]
MKKIYETLYHHKLGPVVICTGISDNTWDAYIKKANGSLKRFTPIKPSYDFRNIVVQLLDYKGKALKYIPESQ